MPPPCADLGVRVQGPEGGYRTMRVVILLGQPLFPTLLRERVPPPTPSAGGSSSSSTSSRARHSCSRVLASARDAVYRLPTPHPSSDPAPPGGVADFSRHP